jgi:hypothetical protein
MNLVPEISLIDFEVHLLMTMKLRITMSHKEADLEAKLAEHGLSLDSAQRTHERVAEFLGGEASYLDNMKRIKGVRDQDSKSLEFDSALWPGFTFKAFGSKDGLLDSARYRRTSLDSPRVDSPIGLGIWSMDASEFAKQFGPMNTGRKWSLFDTYLPAYEEYEFQWGGESYGAGFSWGLFIFTAMSWD